MTVGHSGTDSESGRAGGGGPTGRHGPVIIGSGGVTVARAHDSESEWAEARGPRRLGGPESSQFPAAAAIDRLVTRATLLSEVAQGLGST